MQTETKKEREKERAEESGRGRNIRIEKNTKSVGDLKSKSKSKLQCHVSFAHASIDRYVRSVSGISVRCSLLWTLRYALLMAMAQ